MKNIKIILTIIYCVIVNTTFAQFEPYEFSEKEKEESYYRKFLDGCIPKFTYAYSGYSGIHYDIENFDFSIVKFVRSTVENESLKTVATKLCSGEYDNNFYHIKTECNTYYNEETGKTDTMTVHEFYKYRIMGDNFIMVKYMDEEDGFKTCFRRLYYFKDNNNIITSFDSDIAEFAIKDIWGE